MIQKIYFLSVILTFLFSSAIAQVKEKQMGLPEVYRPNIAIKFVPLNLISRTTAIQFAVEAKTFKAQAIQIEYGYISNLFSRPNTNFKGYKLKSEYRFYGTNPKRLSNNMFGGIQHMYKRVQASGSTPIWRNDRTYQEIVSLTVLNETHAGYILGGKVFPFSDHIFIELALGIGMRILKVTMDGLPEDGEINRGLSTNIFNPINMPGTYHYPDLFVSFKINYKIF